MSTLSSFVGGQQPIKTPKFLLDYSTETADRYILSDGRILNAANGATSITLYQSDGTTVVFTVTASSVLTAADNHMYLYVDEPDGYIYTIVRDTASPYTRQFAKIALSNGAITLIGGSWTVSGTSTVAPSGGIIDDDNNSLLFLDYGEGSSIDKIVTINKTTGTRVENYCGNISGLSYNFITKSGTILKILYSTTSDDTSAVISKAGKKNNLRFGGSITANINLGFIDFISTLTSDRHHFNGAVAINNAEVELYADSIYNTLIGD